MPLVRIPESAFPAFQGLVDLLDTEFDELLSSLEQTPAGLLRKDFVAAVIFRVPSLSLAERIVEELLGMLVAASDTDLSLDEFAAEVSDAALEIKSPNFSLSREKRDLLKNRLTTAFKAKGLRITAKAESVFSDTDKTFHSARVLTDLRPIFDEQASEISGAVVMHNLRIRYYEDLRIRDIYFSLEPAELESLLKVLQRALKKGALLETSLTTTAIPMLK